MLWTPGFPLQLANNSQDLVIITSAFEQVQGLTNIFLGIEELVRVLRPGAFLRVHTTVPEGSDRKRFELWFSNAFVSKAMKIADRDMGLGSWDWYWFTLRKMGGFV